MTKAPKVSVVLPSYKHPLWIAESIESILNQTYTDLELIIVDDGSNDGSAEIIKSYAQKDNRVKFEIFPENKGAVFAFARCMEMTTGQYIALTSSDDIWELDKLEQQVPLLEESNNLGAVFGLPRFIDSKGNELDIKSEFRESVNIKNRESWLNYFFKRGNCVCHPSMLIRKSCYDDVGFYKAPYRSLPDFEMWVRLFNKYEIIVLDKILINFRKHDFNESGANSANIIRHHTEYKQLLNNYIEQIKTIQDLENIFPEDVEHFTVKNDLLVPFYIAQLALKDDRVYFKDFALDILYTELSKPEVLDIINEHNLYSVVEFSKDVVAADIYGISAKRGSSINFKIPFLMHIKKVKQNNKKILSLKVLGLKLFEKISKNKQTKFKLFYITVYSK